MFVLLVLAGAYELPNKAHDLRAGIFGWAKALGSQRALFKSLKIKVGGTEWRIDNKELDMKIPASKIIPKMVGFNISKMIGDALQNIANGKGEESGTTPEEGTQSGTESSAVLADQRATGCLSLKEGSLERYFCTSFGLDSYTDDEYWGMPMGDFFASFIGYIAVFAILIVFFVIDFLFCCVFCWGCCCCCHAKRHSFPGWCNLVTMILSSTLLVISAIFFMCGWMGIGNLKAIYDSFDKEDGLVVTLLDSVQSSLETSFDKNTGFGSVFLPIITGTADNLTTNAKKVATLVEGVVQLGPKINSTFKEISSRVGAVGMEGTILDYVKKNNDIAQKKGQSGQKIDVGQVGDDIKKIEDAIDQMMEQLDQVKTFNDIPTMISDAINPALEQAEEYLGDPLGKLFKDKNITDELAKIKNEIVGGEGIAVDVKKYDKIVQNIYSSLTGIYMITGVCLLCTVAIWLTAFFTYTCCSRCVVNCSCCSLCCCQWCFLFLGLIGSVFCVVTYYAVTWGISFGDGAVQGMYSYSFGGGELAIPDINMSGFTNGMIKDMLHIDPIKLEPVGELNLLNDLFTADASEVTDIVTWMSLDKLFPLGQLAENIKKALNTVLESVDIPEDINKSIQEAVQKIDESSISSDTFGQVNVTKVEEVRDKAKKDWPDVPGVEDQDKTDFIENCNKIIGLLEPIETKYINETSALTKDLGRELGALPGEGIEAIKTLVSEALGGVMDLVKELFPAMKKVNIKFAVQGVNVGIDAGLFTFAQLFVCWSISAHLLLFAMFVTLIMLWVRRPGMLSAAMAEPADLDDLDDDSDSRKTPLRSPDGGAGERLLDSVEPTKDPISSDDDEDDHGTYEFRSKKQSDNSSPSSSSSSDSGDNLGGNTPYTF